RLLALGDRAARAAPAGRAGVRVLVFEAGFLDRLEVVGRRAREIGRAEGIDDDGHALADELVVALLRAAVEAEPVLEAGAPAALDRDAEDGDVLLLRHQLLDLRRRARR